MREYPQTDKEIRMYCLEIAQGIFGGQSIDEWLADAEKLYDFICRESSPATVKEAVKPKANNPDLWYLREGDFRPAPVSEFNGGKGITCKCYLKMLKEAGNLFYSKEAAETQSTRLRKGLTYLFDKALYENRKNVNAIIEEWEKKSH